MVFFGRRGVSKLNPPNLNVAVLRHFFQQQCQLGELGPSPQPGWYSPGSKLGSSLGAAAQSGTSWSMGRAGPALLSKRPLLRWALLSKGTFGETMAGDGQFAKAGFRAIQCQIRNAEFSQCELLVQICLCSFFFKTGWFHTDGALCQFEYPSPPAASVKLSGSVSSG